MLILPVSVVGVFTFQRYVRSMEMVVSENSQETNRRILSNLDYFIYDMERIALVSQTNERILEVLKKGDQRLPNQQQYEYRRRMNQYLNDFMKFKNFIISITAYLNNDTIYYQTQNELYSDPAFRLSDWFKRTVSLGGKKYLFGSLNDARYRFNPDIPVLSLTMRLRDFDNIRSNTFLGVIRIDADMMILEEGLSGASIP